MRIYDPRLGRFLSVDPFTHSYPWYTPYQFASNNPILNIDIDGLEGQASISNWRPFTNERIRTLAIQKGVFQYAASTPVPQLTFNRIVGASFENAFIRAFDLKRNGTNFITTTRGEMVRPDAVTPSYGLNIGYSNFSGETIPQGTFYESPDIDFLEVKTSKILSKATSNGQLVGMIDVLSRMRSTKGKTSKQAGGLAVLYLITTAKTEIAEDLKNDATNKGIIILQIQAYENPKKEGEIKFSNPDLVNPEVFKGAQKNLAARFRDMLSFFGDKLSEQTGQVDFSEYTKKNK